MLMCYNLFMSSHNLPYMVLVIGIVMMIIEIIIGAATGFDLFVLGTIFVISGFFGHLVESNELMLGLIIVVSFLYIFLGRRLIKNKLSVKTQSSNTDALIGKHAKVVKKITPKTAGQVKIEGEIWRAESERTHDVGEKVLIRSYAGTTLYID